MRCAMSTNRLFWSGSRGGYADRGMCDTSHLGARPRRTDDAHMKHSCWGIAAFVLYACIVFNYILFKHSS